MTNRRRLLQGFAVTGVISAFDAEAAVRRRPASPWNRAGEIVARIKPPRFPARQFVLTDYGAAGDGTTNCREAFARAVDACAAAGGGRVLVPAGSWLTGAIRLRSNVDLHLARGAAILFSTNPADYLPLVFTRWEGMELMNYSPLVYAFEEQNVAITGEGTLDGQADDRHWWPWKGQKRSGWVEGTPNQDAARNALFDMSEKNVPVEKRVFGEGFYLRPNFIEPYRCRNVLIEGVTVRNAPFWELHPTLCTNVTVRGVTINSGGPNTDGCDPESCRDVLIEGTSFNTGDDCIAIKSGRNADGRRVNVPTENVVIRNCRMRNGHGGVTIGSEIAGGVRNVFAENCRMDSPDLWNAVRIKDNAMRGGLLENFHFRRLVVGQVSHAVLTVDFNYEEGADGPYRPVLRGVHLDHVVSAKSTYGVDIQGLPDGVVDDIALADCDFRAVAKGNIVKYAHGLKLHNFRINGRLVARLDG